jgi:hypothetical protein
MHLWRSPQRSTGWLIQRSLVSFHVTCSITFMAIVKEQFFTKMLEMYLINKM